VRAYHVAHKAADTAVFVLDNQTVGSALERLTNAGINTGCVLAVLAQAQIGALRALHDPYMGYVGAGLLFGSTAHQSTGLFALAAQVAVLRDKPKRFHEIILFTIEVLMVFRLH
jgi:hypothetical protein